MNPPPGSRLGRFDLVAELGAGGMGRVFRASDRKLGRDVALKVIHPHFGGDAQYSARFHREARVLASLTHPNIAALYEFDEVDGVLFLVMELVPGETLADKLSAGQVPLPHALRIASQLTAALEAAHENGIVHRDLKPANIKVGPDGVAKVLDFGLAKALIADHVTDPAGETVSGATHLGTVVGTTAYMSPEQARGAPVDRRSDIWSFGCVLFEMLTRTRPFAGDTAVDTIASVLERDPDWTQLPPTTPAAIVRLLRRCLQKNPHDRLRDIGDARIEIDEALEAGGSGASPATPERHRRRPSLAPVAQIVLGCAIGAALAAFALSHRSETPPVSGHFVLPLGGGEHLTSVDFPAIALSPDGSRLAYVATRGGRPQLFLRALNSFESMAVPGAFDAVSPFFSHDGAWIAFFADGKLQKAPVAGGPPVTLCEAAIGFGGTWGVGDVIVFAPSSGSALLRVAAAGGAPSRVTRLDAEKGEFSHRWPELLPDGDTVLFTVGTLGSWDDADIVAQSLKSGQRHLIVHGGTNPHYLPPDRLLYARGGAVMSVRFDPARAEVIGEPIRAVDKVLQSADGAVQIGVAQSNVVVYAPAMLDRSSRHLVAVDRQGGVVPYAAPPRAYAYPRVSPDGRRLLVTIAETPSNLWLYDVGANTFNQLTFEGNVEGPVWTPDGQRAAYSSSRAGVPNLFWKSLEPDTIEERLASSTDIQIPGSWSPDGRTLAFVEHHQGTGRDIVLLSRGSDQATTFLASPFDESSPRFAPNGRWIAYVSNASGQNEVYVAEVTDARRHRQVSTDGGAEPVWAPGGRELSYRTGDRLMIAPIGPDGAPGRPRAITEGPFERGTVDAADYDITPDGQRFVMVAGSGAREQTVNDLHVLVGALSAAAAAR